MRVIDLTLKDLYQIVRDWKAAVFLLIMPVAFTLLFGFVFSGSGQEEDPRMPVGVLNLDNRQALSVQLISLLDTSDVIRPIIDEDADEDVISRQVADGDLVAALVIPTGYSQAVISDDDVTLQVIAEDNTDAGHTAYVAVRAMVNRFLSAVQTAQLTAETLADVDPSTYAGAADRNSAFDAAMAQMISKWEDPPFTVTMSGTGQAEDATSEVYGESPYSHSSAGMMAQFGIAGLIGAAEILVAERKSRTLQRMLTTAISKAEVIIGHFLAMFVMVFVQLLILAVFGGILGVAYFSVPFASLLMLVAFAFFAAALGMLISALAKNEDQVVIFALVPMFVLSGLGGAWMPLEFTPETFQAVAHFTPVTWAVDGLKNITVRGLGLSSVLLPAAILFGFGLLCLVIAIWQFRTE